MIQQWLLWLLFVCLPIHLLYFWAWVQNPTADSLLRYQDYILPISAISGHIDRTSFCKVSFLHFLCFPTNLLKVDYYIVVLYTTASGAGPTLCLPIHFAKCGTLQAIALVEIRDFSHWLVLGSPKCQDLANMAEVRHQEWMKFTKWHFAKREAISTSFEAVITRTVMVHPWFFTQEGSTLCGLQTSPRFPLPLVVFL